MQRLSRCKCVPLKGIAFLLKFMFFSIFKLRNLKTLSYRYLTVLMVVLHYIMVEKIDISDLVENEYALFLFITVWHLIFMNLKILEESRRKNHEEFKHFIAVLGATIVLVCVLVILFTPIVSYFNFQIMELKSHYWTLRYIWMCFYVLGNISISVFPLVNNFLFFLTDGIILSQIACLYLANEFSMTCFLNLAPILFICQNHFLIRGIFNFDKDEQKQKLSFVRLVGKHDAVFLFVIYSMFIFLLNLLDLFTVNYFYGLNFWYSIYSIFAFGKLMDGKKVSVIRYISFLTIPIYLGIYVYTMSY